MRQCTMNKKCLLNTPLEPKILTSLYNTYIVKKKWYCNCPSKTA